MTCIQYKKILLPVIIHQIPEVARLTRPYNNVLALVLIRLTKQVRRLTQVREQISVDKS